MKRILFFITALLYINISAQNTAVNSNITIEEIKDHIEYLASEELQGRFTGSEGCYLAGEYIKNEFEKYGLTPLSSNSYFQNFDFIKDVEQTEKNKVSFIVNKISYPLELNKNFVTVPFSDRISTSTKLAFVGYGISAPKLKYDDYKNIDVREKVVIILRNSPDYKNPHSQFDNYTSLRVKLSTAREKGAKGVIFVNGLVSGDKNDKLIKVKYDRGSKVKDIGGVHVKQSFIKDVFETDKLDLQKIEESIIENKTPNSFDIKNTRVSFTTEIKEIKNTGRNVAAVIKANNSDEYIVIGAHYDHLGYGGHGSLYRGKDLQIHNGADDNSSGTTAVMELAEKLASIKSTLKKNIIFVTFSGEELGLLGSNYFVNNLPIPVENISAMINLDMVGRLNEEKSLTVFGIGTSRKWENLVNSKNTYDLQLALKPDGYGPSDHSSFYGKKIPVLFFFTGTHSDYHRPSDDAHLINNAGLKTVIDYVFDIAQDIASSDERPDYVYIANKQKSNMGGWKVYVGTIPDYAYEGEGFKLTGVSEGGPADKAGIKGGDIMLKFGAKKLDNIYDYVYALKEYVPGDKVEVIVKRNKETLKFNLELGSK